MYQLRLLRGLFLALSRPSLLIIMAGPIAPATSYRREDEEDRGREGSLIEDSYYCGFAAALNNMERRALLQHLIFTCLLSKIKTVWQLSMLGSLRTWNISSLASSMRSRSDESTTKIKASVLTK